MDQKDSKAQMQILEPCELSPEITVPHSHFLRQANQTQPQQEAGGN